MGFVVGEVLAEDIDSGTFGEVVYTISGLGSEKYVVLIVITILSLWHALIAYELVFLSLALRLTLLLELLKHYQG